jgi:hypothetical protein
MVAIATRMAGFTKRRGTIRDLLAVKPDYAIFTFPGSDGVVRLRRRGGN